MKIGIIVHSQTGNTYSVALKLREKLLTAGHSVNIEKVLPLDEKAADVKKLQLKNIPDISTYDALIFGAPVHAFSLSPAMTAYLTQLASLHSKKVACLITQSFPYAWMGGNRSMKQMKALCQAKGAIVCGAGIVNWTSKQREEKINNLVEKFSALF